MSPYTVLYGIIQAFLHSGSPYLFQIIWYILLLSICPILKSIVDLYFITVEDLHTLN